MADAPRGGFVTDYAVPPGDTLRETLDSLGMSQSELARRTDLSTKHINQIIQGEAPITAETAIAFERATRVPARIWNSLESNYRAQRVRIAQRRQLGQGDVTWLKEFPTADLIRRGAIPGSNDPHLLFDQVLTFFGVASRNAWEQVWRAPDAAFRQSPAFRADEFAVATWLRLGELEAAKADVRSFDRAAFRDALLGIRAVMTKDPDLFMPTIVDLCAQSGVAVVLVSEVKGTRASGAARWVSPVKAVIQLSLRYHWEDHFWFSLFHEGGHIYLHGKRRAFVDVTSAKSEAAVPSEFDAEANRFAADLLIPSSAAARLGQIGTRSEILELAMELDIPPGIIVGRMQREGHLPWHAHNDLRRRFVLNEP